MKDQLTRAECVDKEQLNERISQYFIDVQKVDKSDLKFILMDFEDPYMCDWVNHDYVQYCEVDGVRYVVYTYWTSFFMIAETFTDDVRFKFYMLMRDDDIENGLVAEHMAAERLYVVDGLVDEDFPEYVRN